MKLYDLLQDVEILSSTCEPDFEARQISSDSRTVLSGGVFICIKGERCDGHDFIPDAVAKGAAALIVSDPSRVPSGIPYVQVRNTRLAEAHLWNRWYSCPAEGMRVIAVTGTNGKTSCAYMLREIFKSAGYRVGVITTVKAMAGDEVIGASGGSSVSDAVCAMTTPDPEYLYGIIYIMKQKRVDTLVFEASSHAIAQQKIDPLRIDIALFTNLTAEHLDFHGDMEGYFEAKARLASLAQRIVINADDPYVSRLIHRGGGRVITCSADPDGEAYRSADVSALRQRYLGLEGVEYVYFSRDAVFRQRSCIPGRYTVYNTMLASAAAISMGISPESVREGIAALNVIDGRLEEIMIRREDLPFRVFVDYAHTAAALESLLATVRDVRREGERITVLFGCGGDRDPSKRRQMGAVASRLADFVIVTGDNSRSESTEEIIKSIILGIDREKPHAVIPDRREAIEYAIKNASAGEIVLLVGKGHEKYEIDSDGKHPFDEAKIVRDAVKRFW